MPLNPKLEKIVQKDYAYLLTLEPQQVRDIINREFTKLESEGTAVGSIVNNTIKTTIRETPIRIYYPKKNGIQPALIYLHGGGLVVGNIESQDSVCREITNNVNCVVVSIDYGLAPEHRVPESAEECYQVTKWVYENAKSLSVNPDKIAIMGESAGGTLAAVVSQLSRDRGEFRLTYQVLIYPVTDLEGQTNSRLEYAHGYVLTIECIEWCNKWCLRDIIDAKKPMASPLLAESFENLPAACIITAEYDPLRDEGEAYAARLSEAGVEVCTKRYDGIIHGFFRMQGLLQEARSVLSLVCDKLSDAFYS